MDSSIAAHTSRVRTLAARRPSQILLVSLLLLVFIAAWYAMSRAALTTSAATAKTSTRVAAVTSQDAAMQPWMIPTPAPEVRVAPAPAAQVDPTDWSALSLGVSNVGVVPVASLATSARPAELNSSMSDRERRTLLASVKSGEPDGLPSPQGYTPGIVQIVPGGANSDGICR